MSGGGGGAGGGLITDANARLLVEDGVGGPEDEATSLRELPVLDFSEDLDLSVAFEDGDPLGSTWTAYVLEWGRGPNVYSPSPPLTPGDCDFVSVGAEYGPTLTSPGMLTKHIASTSGDFNTGWTYTPSEFGCGIGPGSGSGWLERERWFSLPIPAHPADMAGLTFAVTIGNPGTSVPENTVHVRVRDAEPTAGRQGAIVATIPIGSSTVYIPAANVPAEGGTIWIGFTPGWQADYDLDAYAPAGYPAVCWVGWHGLPFRGNGFLNVVSFADFTWQTYTAEADDLGTTPELDGENDPWEGGNSIIDMGAEGSPTAAMGGGSFVVTGEGGRCIAIVGELEDEDEPNGPWSEPWRTSFEFMVSDLGDTGDSQLSHIEVTATRAGERLTGTVHFGDTGHAAGISVATPEGEAFTAVTITADVRWAVRFDDRSEGWFRGKLWKVSDGEPAAWTVEVAVPDESDEEGDRVVVCIRAQAGQTITMYQLTAMASAQGGMVHERLGIASGDTDLFITSHQFVAGTLEYEFAGVFAPPVRESGATCEGWTDYKPTAGMVVWARYLSEGG